MIDVREFEHRNNVATLSGAVATADIDSMMRAPPPALKAGGRVGMAVRMNPLAPLEIRAFEPSEEAAARGWTRAARTLTSH